MAATPRRAVPAGGLICKTDSQESDMTSTRNRKPRAARRPKAHASRRPATATLLHDIAAGVSARVGEDFFRSLVLYLAKTLGAELAFVGKLTGDGREIETIAMCYKGRIVANLRYALAGTPCELVVRKEGPGIYPRDVQRLFPKDRPTAEMNLQSYAGTPLCSSAGEVLGVVGVMGTRPLKDTRLARQLLEIFASRAVAELERVRAGEALRESERHLARAQEVAQLGSWNWDIPANRVAWSEQTYRLFGVEPDPDLDVWALIDRTVHPGDKPLLNETIRACAQDGRSRPLTFRLRLPDGSERVIAAEGTARLDAAGRPLSMFGTMQDVTERERSEDMLRRLGRILDDSSNEIYVFDADTLHFVQVNRGASQNLGYSMDEMRGLTPIDLKPEYTREGFAQLVAPLRGGSRDMIAFETVHRRKDGSRYPVEVRLQLSRTETPPVFVAIIQDITERIQNRERLQHLAHHDALTELPNRALLLDRLNQSLARARWHQRLVAVLFIDLDRFKTINDTLGHEVGDRLLQQLGERFGRSVREGDTVARFGGDEFAILLDDVASDKDVGMVAQKVLDALTPPFTIDGQNLYITASIGVSLFPGDGDDTGTLLKNADIAMYRAKELGKNNYQFYSADMSARAFERLSLETSLRHALEHNEFRLYHQPQIDTSSGAIIGVEALLRWQHPDFGLVPPAEFISLLEETGLIVPVSDWMFRTACEQLCAWHAAGWPMLRMAVNLSPRQFQADGLVAMVERTLASVGCDPGLIELEITENVLLRHTAATLDILDGLRTLGVGMAIDDFGTGYSSLSYLRRHAIDTLKVDRSFVRDIPDDPDDSAITSAIISLAQSLNLDVIAEGVETGTQREFLRERGCHLMQGYLFSRPLPAEDIPRWLETHNARG